MATETTMKITGDDIYELMTSPAMEPALLRNLETGEAEVRSAMYASDFPERFEVIISRDDAIALDQSGDYSGEGVPSDEWCEMVAGVVSND